MRMRQILWLLALLLISSTLVATTAVQARGQAAAEPTCVAIVLPSVTGADGDAIALGQSLRDLMISYLTGPTIKSMPLEARLPDQAIEEARQKKSCGYVLVSAFTRKGGGGRSVTSVVGAAAQGASGYIPYAGGVGSAAARSAAAAGTYAVGSMAASTRAKDELTLEFRIGTPDTVMKATPHKESVKAKANGEDLATPLVEHAATAILRQLPK